MPRLINGSLFVSAFNPTGTPGEYTVENAVYSNQADATGNGAFDIQLGYVIFVPASDLNTFAPIPGILHRYKITDITVIDPSTINCTVLWDEQGPEEDAPTNGAFCLISQVTDSNRIALPPAAEIYPDLPAGSTAMAIINDLKNIIDRLQGGGGPVQLNKFTRTTEAGVLSYDLPELPASNNLIVFINGAFVSYTVSGVTVTITEYTPGTIDDTDELTVYYPT